MNTNKITIRETTATDFNDIMTVIRQAFGQETEAQLTADMLADHTALPIASLIALEGDDPVGHILFTRAYFSEQPEPQHSPMMHILAPLAVKPEYQRQGVGGMLIRTGVERVREIGSHLVFVLGHKDYYPRHGFIPDAEALGYPAPYPILEKFKDCWMIQPLTPNGFDVGNGTIACCDTMNKPEYWSDDEPNRK
jgi:putative acetyltransferase